ncbi:hypothetical protein [Dongia deserti]|uniref:hypothetical protein n=1 Tax=Dongia deserti TaxID=2268030 RepID=UPI000E647157|nr:hypothetical protein [Dongia deserti]
MLHVAIVVHRHDRFDRLDYWLRAISECWLESGIRVSVVKKPKARVDADLAILHVDLTVIPQEYLACVRRFVVTVNGEVSDISKRAISTNLLDRGDRYEGPVIVKTNRNCAGYPEERIARNGWKSRKRRHIVRSALDHFKEGYIRARRRRRYGSDSAFLDYTVFDSMTEVPDAVWSDNDLVVERFLPERINGRYCIRTWLFFGDQDRHAIFFSHDPVIKSHNIVDFERLSEVPEELRQIRRNLKFDFGKFDYTMVDGRPVLFDANRTPTIGDFPKERYLPLAKSLATGIGAFVRDPLELKPQPPAPPEPAGNDRMEEA